MTFTRKLTSITTALALAVTAVGPLATSASAEGWHKGGGGPDHGYARSERRDWDGDRHNGSRHRYGYRRHRHDNTGKYIALGVGALMLGIIASEAARR